MSVTVGSGESQTVASGDASLSPTLNLAGELNLVGEFNLLYVVGTFAPQASVSSGAFETTFGGSIATATFAAPPSGGADGRFASATVFVGPPSIGDSGTFGPEASPLVIEGGESLAVSSGSSISDAPVNVGGTLQLEGEVNTFDQDASLAFGIAGQFAQPNTIAFEPVGSFAGDGAGQQDDTGFVIKSLQFGGKGFVPGSLSATFAPSMVVTEALSDVAPVAWQVTINEEEIVEDVFDVEVVDTANPFGNYAIIYADDISGDKFAKFARGTRVDIAYSDNDGITFENRFTGYVVESREYDDAGSDSLEVECYTFDQFLRRNAVSNDQTGNTISQALADIIQTDTPVTYVAGNIEVGDDVELSQSFVGDPVEEVLRTLSFKSVNEFFGVNRDGEFFFAPPEGEVNPRGIDNTRWLNYDITEEGKDTINEVEVFYDGDSKSVTVDETNDKLKLQEGLNLNGPGTQRAEINRPEITDIRDAEDVGRRFLELKNETLTGTVTSFDLYDLTPGDTIAIEIKPRGIDDEFKVAEVRYHWGTSETTLTIIEKRGDVDDILFDLSNTVKRIETADVNRTGITDKLMRTGSGVIIDAEVAEFGTGTPGVTSDKSVVTNVGLGLIRDSFINETSISLDSVRLGDSNRSLSRANTDLQGELLQTGSLLGSVDVSSPNEAVFTFDVTATIQEAEEVGLFTDEGEMFARFIVTGSDLIDVDNVQVTISVNNDPEVERGIFTTEGLSLFRDIIADNSPGDRLGYAFGSDNTQPEVTDTSLGSETIEFESGSITFAAAGTATEFENIGPDLSADVTLDYRNGGIDRIATGGWQEIPGDEFTSQFTTTVSGQHSGGTALELDGNSADVIVRFGLDYDPDDRYLCRFKGSFDNFTGNVNLLGSGFQVIDSYSTSNNNNKNVTLDSFFVNNPSGLIVRGIGISNVQQGSMQVDGFEFFDFDNLGATTGTFNTSTNTYPGPKFFGGSNSVTFPTFTSPRTTDEVTVQSTWNNVSGNQFLELTDGNNETIKADNTANHVFNFASVSDEFTLRIGFDEFADDPTSTPTEGGATQRITSLSVTSGLVPYSPDDIGAISTRALLEPNLITGTVVAEGGIKTDLNGDQLSRVRFADFTVLQNQRLVANEKISIRNGEID